LRAGIFCFQPLQRITLSCGERIDLWSARDALVLKAMTLVLADILPVSQPCTHVKGNGGAKQAVRQVHDQLGDNRFILRSDVKSYYASIDHMILLDQLAVHIQDRGMLNLLAQYLQRTTEFGGAFVTCKRGISLGCPLSPLIGAFFLTSVDDIFERSGLFYVRFMDDFLIMARSRHAIRRAMRWLTQELNKLKLEKHPDKTFIGRASRGFDFLGNHFAPGRLTLAATTIDAFHDICSRLYEQKRCRMPSGKAALEAYIKRWKVWAKGGLGTRLSHCQPWLDKLPASTIPYASI
jgi:RNA-directed DNA polymerase